MRIAFIGDPHFDYSTPVSRLDDYKELTITKLNSLLKLAVDNKINIVFMTGDIFNKVDQSLTYIHDLINALNKFKENNIDIYAIWGNHDLRNNNLAISDKTPLSLLFKAGIIKYLSIEGIRLNEDTHIYGLDFTRMNELDNIKVEVKTNILMMHYATDNTIPYESIGREQLTNFDIVVSGHDHMYYPMSGLLKPVMLRPGSFTRRTKDDYNLQRDIIVYVYDCDSKDIVEHKLPNVKPAKEVFKNEVFLDKTGIYNFYSKDYNELFATDFFESETTDFGEMIEELPETVFKESKKAIKEAAINEGIIIKKT